jgi:hypothetical protein
MIAAEECIKAGMFGALGHGEKLRIASALLGFCEYTKLHETNLTGMHPVVVGNAKLLRESGKMSQRKMGQDCAYRDRIDRLLSYVLADAKH